jgi:hypothetical protein
MPKPFDMAIAKSPPSDPQRHLLYRMENEAIGARQYLQLTRAQLTRYINSLVRAYRMPKVVIRFGELGRWAAEWCEPNILTFAHKAASRDLLTAAHEVAHHLHGWLSQGLVQEGHGPEFMACYMSILDTTRHIPVAGMRAICRQYGVRFKDPGDTSDITELVRAVRGRLRPKH